MILDIQNILSDNQALTSGNIVSTNCIDLWGQAAVPTIPQGTQTLPVGSTNISVLKDVGRGSALNLLVQVTAALTGGTSIIFQVIGATATDLTTGQIIYQETAGIVAASLVAGYQARLSVPAGITLRYLGIRYAITGTFGAGTVTAGIVGDKQTMPFVG